MNQFYVATMIAAVVTVLLASRVLALRASRSAIPRVLARLKFDVEWCLRDARNLVDDWIAANLADRERRAVTSLLHDFGDREAGRIDLDRGGIGRAGCGCEQNRPCRLWDRSGGSAGDEVDR